MREASAPRLAGRASKQAKSSLPRVARLLALAVLGGSAIGVYLALSQGTESGGGKLLFRASFANSGLVTNEYAFYNPRDVRAARSPAWEVTSGSLFAIDGNGWTGVPDGAAADITSSNATDSAVLRVRSRQDDFANVAVSFRLFLRRFVVTPRTPAQAHDGVHVWLRYQSPYWLYFASVSRRDGSIVIGKKLPDGAGGRYVDLTRVTGHPFPFNHWETVKATIASDGDSVVIKAFVGGRLLATAVDGGNGGPAILRAGRVGIRGDNAEFEFGGFQVTQE